MKSKWEIHLIYSSGKHPDYIRSFDFAVRTMYQRFGVDVPVKTIDIDRTSPQNVNNIYVNRQNKNDAPEMVLVLNSQNAQYFKANVTRPMIRAKMAEADNLFSPEDPSTMDPENQQVKQDAVTLDLAVEVFGKNGLLIRPQNESFFLRYWKWMLAALLLVLLVVFWKKVPY